MAKQIACLEMQNQYPFLQTRQKAESGSEIQVRKCILYDSEPRFIIKEKIRMLKSLGFQNLVGLESSKSEEHAIILFFQFVPFQFVGEINTLTEEQMNKIHEGMLELCDGLASRSIIHELDVQRVGLDRRYNIKYFLGVDFKLDKTADKLKIHQNYKNLIQTFFSQVCQPCPAFKPIKDDKTKEVGRLSRPFETPKSPKNEKKLQIKAKHTLGVEDTFQRKMLKKSSILDTDHKDDDLKAIKMSNRFTFNNDNQIHLPINEKPEISYQKGNQAKPLKIEELNSRINRLKGYMKEITTKITKNSASANPKPDQSNSSSKVQPNKNRFLSPNISKFQKRITELRDSKVAISAKTQEIINKKHNDCPQVITPKGKGVELLHKTEDDKIKLPANKQTLYKTVEYPTPSPPQVLPKNNSLNICEDDRQHKEYIMLANKDKYCEQFMNFLEDNQTSLQASLLNQKPAQISGKSTYHQPQLQQSPKKCGAIKQNLKTQSSENALEIQNRVQKVIRSSLKLINGLRTRETIRCE